MKRPTGPRAGIREPLLECHHGWAGIVVGEIIKIQGEQYSIKGERGQEIGLRVTTDTNKVCGEGQGTRFSTGQEGAKDPFYGKTSR